MVNNYQQLKTILKRRIMRIKRNILFDPQITQITQIFFFFVHKGYKMNQKIFRARRARTQNIVDAGDSWHNG